MKKLMLEDAKRMVVEAGPSKGFGVIVESLVEVVDDDEELHGDVAELSEEYDGYDFKGTAIRTEDGVEVPIDAHVFLDCDQCGHIDTTIWDRSPSPENLEYRERISRQRSWGPFNYTPDRWSLWKWWLLALTHIVDGVLNIPLAVFACHCELTTRTVFWLAKLDMKKRDSR